MKSVLTDNAYLIFISSWKTYIIPVHYCCYQKLFDRLLYKEKTIDNGLTLDIGHHWRMFVPILPCVLVKIKTGLILNVIGKLPFSLYAHSTRGNKHRILDNAFYHGKEDILPGGAGTGYWTRHSLFQARFR